MPRRLALYACVALALSCRNRPPAPPGRPAAEVRADAARLEADLAARVDGWLAAGEWARADGWVYGVDLGQLLVWAARAGDQARYGRLKARLLADFPVEVPCDATTRGMVAWRTRPGTRPDASGTTEALRIAEGLWEGGLAFGHDEDRRRALRLVEGWARHAAELDGRWLVQNYFNLTTRSFATNTFLIDYDPDLVRDVARATRAAALAGLDEKTLALLESARSPSGLLYEVVQPEMATLTGPDGVVFSPNDAVQLVTSLAVAERTVASDRALAERILAFARARLGTLAGRYTGRDGAPLAGSQASAEVWAALVRLAVRLGDDATRDAALDRLVAAAERFAAAPKDPRLYTAGELLLAFQAVRTPRGPRDRPLEGAALGGLSDDEIGPVRALSPSGRAIYHLLLEEWPPRAADGEACHDPTYADVARATDAALAGPFGTDWPRRPALRHRVKAVLTAELGRAHVEPSDIPWLVERVTERLARLAPHLPQPR